MRRMRAISIGARVKPHRVNGSIHSVFADACNMENAEGEIFTLLTLRTPDQPGGLRLASPPGFSFRDYLSAGDRVSCRPGILEVRDRAFVVDLRHAETWSRRLSLARKGWVASNWLIAADAFLSVSGSRPRESAAPGGNPLMRVWDVADALTRAASEKDWEAASGAMRSLIGCGPGLTPWGDDFVAGFLAGTDCFAADPVGARVLARLRDLCSERVGTTSDISRSILLDAMAGLYGMPVYDLCEAIFGPGSKRYVIDQVRIHMDIGDSSGEANCYGILSGIAMGSGSEALIARHSRLRQ